MINLQKISYTHPNKDILFTNINITINPSDKIALVGNNGSGKSTLLQLIAKKLIPTSGQIINNSKVYYIPQIYGQYDHYTVAEALGIADKLHAMREIIQGSVSEKHFELLDNDWQIEDKCIEALKKWEIPENNMFRKIGQLSGGQKTKVFLAGIELHNADILLMDEPSNHLDSHSRNLLYNCIESTNHGLMIVSHDRQLLNLTKKTYELSHGQVKIYGGNYNFYQLQKEHELETQVLQIQSKEKDLKKAKEQERKTLERFERTNARGKKKQENAGISRIMMNTLRNAAENSTSKAKDVHRSKITNISTDLTALRSDLLSLPTIKLNIENSGLHRGKTIYQACDLNVRVAGKLLWNKGIQLHIESGDRISLRGNNGSGKTTLINILLGKIKADEGSLKSATVKSIYFDQDYSLIEDQKSIYEMAQSFNDGGLEEHEVKIRLNRFLFPSDTWGTLCSSLSGGQRVKLILCCLTICEKSPDILFMDEPTNNIDIQSMDILTKTLSDYQGTLVVVSHDETFLSRLNINRTITLG